MKKIYILYILQLSDLSMNNNSIKNFQKNLKLQTNKKRYVNNYRCGLVQNSQELYVKFYLNLSFIK